MGELSTLALLTLSAFSLSSDRPFVLAGGDDGAVLEIRAPATTAANALRVNASAGSLSAPEPAGPGIYRVRFSPPPERYPHVSLISVCDGAPDGACTFHSLPLHGQETLKFATKKHANVTVYVGAAAFGPQRADERGSVSIPVVVPPGTTRAKVHSRDRFGNHTTRWVDLTPPDRPRVVLVPSHQSASWADPTPVRVHGFTVDRSGAPGGEEAVQVAASSGDATLTPSSSAAGTFVIDYRAPKKITEPTARLRVFRAGEESAGAELELALRPGPPTQVRVASAQQAYTAGSGGRIAVTVQVLDANGNAIAQPEALRVWADLGTLKDGADSAAREWTLPDDFGGRQRAVVHAQIGAMKAQQEVLLLPGAAGGIEVDPERLDVRAGGEPARFMAAVKDRFGNRINAAPVIHAGGLALEAAAPEEALYTVHAPKEAPVGAQEVRFAAPTGEELGRATVRVLPHRSGWALGGGVQVGGRTNFARGRNVSADLSLHLRIAETPFDAFIRGGYVHYDPVRTPLDSERSIDAVASLQGLGVLAGLRYGLPVTTAFEATAALGLGAQQTRVEQRLERGGVAFGEADTSETFWSPTARLAVGGMWRVGPGRVTAEVGVAHAAAQFPLRGQLAGADVVGGYLFDFR